MHQRGTSKGAYLGGIPRGTPTGAPGKKNDKQFQPSKNSAVTPRKRKITKNENWENKSGYTRKAVPYDIKS